MGVPSDESLYVTIALCYFPVLWCAKILSLNFSFPCPPQYWLFLQKVLVSFSGSQLVFRDQNLGAQCWACLLPLECCCCLAP